MPDISTISANSTALAPLFDKPLRASKKAPNEAPKTATVIPKSPSDPVMISLNEAFDPPNIGDVVCTGNFSAQASYQRYQPSYGHQSFQGPVMNVQYHHPYHRPPIMSQKKKRQLAQNPHQQMVYTWPTTYLIPCSSNQFPSISTQPTPDFDDFDPEKAAEEMFFNKNTE